MAQSIWNLDFSRTVRDFDFTRKAMQGISRVISSEDFEDMDVDAIFDYLLNEMKIVVFKDYLKRYIYDDYPIIKEAYLPKFLNEWNKLPEGVQHLILKRKTPIKLGIKSKHSGADMVSRDGYWYFVKKMGEYVAGEYEVGHFLDDINYNGTFKYSNSNAWRKLPKKEREAISGYDRMSDQNTYNDQELFAEAFKIYMLDPD